MEEDKKIDELFRDGLESHSMEPPDRVWDALDARLTERKRRRGGWLMLGALLLLTGGTAWYFAGPSSTGTVATTGQTTAGQVEDAGSHGTSMQPAVRMTSGSTGHASLLKHNNSGSQQSSQASTASTQQQQSSSRLLRMPSASTVNAPSGQSSSSSSSSTTSPGSGSATKGPDNPPSGTSPGSNTQKAGDAPAGDGNIPGPVGGSPDVAEVTMNVPPDNVVNAPVPPADAIVLVALTEAEQAQPESNPDATPAPDTTLPVRPVDEKLLHTLNRNLLLDIYFAPEISNRTLHDNAGYSGAGSMNSIEQYQQNSSSGFSWQAGVRMRYNLGRQFSVGTGLAYSRFTQTTQLGDVYVMSDSAYHQNFGGSLDEASSHYVIQTSCGPISLQGIPPIRNHNYCENPPRNGDTLLVSAATDVVVESFQVPLTVRYRLQCGRIHWYAETGAAINILYRNDAVVRIGDSYQETNTLVGLKKTTYSFLFSLGMEYPVNQSFGLFLEPGLRYYLTPVNENSPVLSYPYFFGIKGGVSLKF